MKTILMAAWLATSTLVLTSGCMSDRYHENGERADDSAISMRIKNALDSDSQHKFAMVDVKTYKRTVQLSGFVDTPEQRRRAGAIANAVDGIRTVENNITVK